MSRFLFLLVFFLILTGEGVMAAKKNITVQGHRGARGVLPENTLAGFKYALEVGADLIELDLGVTKDNILVVSHDPVINEKICLDPQGKAIEGKIPLRSLTYTELQKYDCGSLKNPRFPQQKQVPGASMPSLESVFQWIISSKEPGAKTVEFNIETKSVPGYPQLTPTPKVFAKLLVKLIKKYNLEKRVIIQSFDHRTLKEARKLSKQVRLSALFGGNLLNYRKAAKEIGAKIISPNQHWITKADVKDLHKHGFRISPWTANTEEDWQRLIELGVDSIITDYPAELIAFLKSKGLRK